MFDPKNLFLVALCLMLLLPASAFSQQGSSLPKMIGGIASETFKDLSEWPIGFPSANMDIAKAVPIEDVLRIASYEASRTWGNADIICNIPCCDQNGDIVAFLVVFQISSENQPTRSFSEVSYTAIQKEIQQARERYPAAHLEYRNARNEMAKRIKQVEKGTESRVAGNNEAGKTDSPRPEVMNIPATDSFKDAYLKTESLRNKMTGAGRFGTVLVSARYDLIPVPAVIHALPPFYTRGDLLQKKAHEAIGGRSTLKRMYLAGPLDQWYEFENPEGKSILVDPFKGRTYPQNRIHQLMGTGILMKADPNTATKEWRVIRDAAKEGQK